MRNVALLGARLVLGGYLAAHGAQKLFGAFGGSGLDKTAASFDKIGLTPGKPMATLAAATELGGGVLTAAGIADPLGPLAIAGTMTVAATTHRANGPLAANRGFELPLTNAAAAVALAAAGPGRFRFGPRMPSRLAVAAAVGGGALAAGSIAKLLSPARPRPQDDQPGAQPSRGAAGTAANGQVTRTADGNGR